MANTFPGSGIGQVCENGGVNKRPYVPVPLSFVRCSAEESRARAHGFCEQMRTRRSVRHFSREPIPIDAVERCIDAAAQAPSGANKQPWTFVLVTDPLTKSAIREAAEQEERAFYAGRASERWIEDLAELGTGPDKPFLEDAPALIVIFAQRHGTEMTDRHYYVMESVGISVGFLLAGLHLAGFATLTHTPAPMEFLRTLLNRPANERAFCIVPVGYPVSDCEVPDISRKDLKDVLIKA